MMSDTKGGHGSVVDPNAPKAEQEQRVEDEIEKSDAALYGDKPARERKKDG
jgi:hypothetical protein